MRRGEEGDKHTHRQLYCRTHCPSRQLYQLDCTGEGRDHTVHTHPPHPLPPIHSSPPPHGGHKVVPQTPPQSSSHILRDQRGGWSGTSGSTQSGYKARGEWGRRHKEVPTAAQEVRLTPHPLTITLTTCTASHSHRSLSYPPTPPTLTPSWPVTDSRRAACCRPSPVPAEDCSTSRRRRNALEQTSPGRTCLV